MNIKKFPPLKQPDTWEQLGDRIQSTLEDVLMGATSIERGTDFILDDVLHYIENKIN